MKKSRVKNWGPKVQTNTVSTAIATKLSTHNFFECLCNIVATPHFFTLMVILGGP
jgi:hypothetical protein